MARVKERGGVEEERFYFSRCQNQNPILRSFLAPKPNRNACYASYILVKGLDFLPVSSSWSNGWLWTGVPRLCMLFVFSVFAQSLLASSCLSYVVLSTAIACNIVHHARFLLREVFPFGRSTGTVRCNKHGLCNE